MTSPSSFYTAQRIIRFAYRDAGLIQEGGEPNSEQYADGLMRLNDIANIAQVDGLKLWTILDQPITLLAGHPTYTLSPTGDVVMAKPLKVIQGYCIDPNGIRRPIVPMSWEEWTRLSQVNQQGQINSYFVDKQRTALSVSFWLVPDSVMALSTAHLIIQQQMGQMVSLTDQTAFPIEWSMFLRWALADDISTGQPVEIVGNCQSKHMMYKEKLENWDIEDVSVMFTPDQRSSYYNRFPG